MYDLICINKFDTICEDQRGSLFSFSLPRKQSEFLMITRKKGSISGNSYAKGTIESFLPKIFILLSGKINLSYRKVNTIEVFNKYIEAPVIISISPLTIVKVEAIEDFSIIECNSIQDVKHDMVKENI